MSGVDIPSILAGAYDAALQDDLWKPWSEELFCKLGGSGGLFGLHDTSEKSLDRIITLSAPARSIDEYVAGYHQFDPQVAMVSALPGSNVYLGIPGIDPKRKDVADYLRWQREIARIAHHQTAVMTLGNSPLRVSICVHRSHELGAVTRDQHRALRRLAPELERALGLAFRHSELLQTAFWDGIIVGRSDQVAFLLDERGRVIRHTDAAGALLARYDGLDVVNGHLTPLETADVAALRSIVVQAIQPISPTSGAMRISRRSGKQPLILVSYPLQRSSRMIAPLEAAALVTIVDPASRLASPGELYRQAFGLTNREADLATLLTDGYSVESAAASLNMMMATARMHLRRLYEKTGTSGQVSLIRLLGRIG